MVVNAAIISTEIVEITAVTASSCVVSFRNAGMIAMGDAVWSFGGARMTKP